MNILSPRQESILNRIVDAHIQSAQPVGSRHITDLYQEIYRSSYSPATVRHEMGRLEEMGYLTHPHTSAGRVPTDLGYRYYVDHSLREEVLSEEFLRQINAELSGFVDREENFSEQVSRLLSKLTGEVSVCMERSESDNLQNNTKPVRLSVQGSSWLLEKPEFQSLEKIHIILKALEEKEVLVRWVEESAVQSGVSVKIGRENGLEVFQACTLITACYSGRAGFSGTIAVLGPQRMKYSLAMPIVSQIARTIANIFEAESPSWGND